MKTSRYVNIVKRVLSNPRYLSVYWFRYRSIVMMWLAYLCILPFRNRLNKRDIWLIGEKGTEARDNGYHFYRYIRENHPEINAYFTIAKNSPDVERIAKYKNTIWQNSFLHYIYYLSAKVSANSQPYGAIPEPTYIMFQMAKKLHRKDQIVIHLKHGITKDELPHYLDYKETKFDLICCVSEKERSFMQKTHGYPDENIKALGFCRYDSLLDEHRIKRQVLIMPTHRMWLHAADSSRLASDKEMKVFMRTDYYQVYSELLKDAVLLDYLRKKGFSIVFYPHYALQSFIHCFDECENDVVKIADREHYDVQQLLLESKLLITDYSSVFFDFAYMGKPVIYYQFDEQEYRAGHFKKGYFDYRKDGFGPVFDHKEDVIAETMRLVKKDCSVDFEYQKRIDSFFVIHDNQNCKRIFDEVYRKAMVK